MTMEALGKVHPCHRLYDQWNQMSYSEQKLHINDIADIHIDIAKRYDHSAIFVQSNLQGFEAVKWLLEVIREKTGDEYYLMMHGDPTWAIPDGDSMMDFAARLDQNGHLLDGFTLCSDYCFNVNPFFTPDQFAELIAPYLKRVIDEYRKMGYYSIKHTDGNIMPILKQIVDCGPDAIHSLDPQGNVDLRKAREIVGDSIALVGNVNCGLLQTGTDEECDADVLRALREGMADGKGYIFSTSNCVYTGLPLERYERMWELWRKYGVYPEKSSEERAIWRKN